MNSVLVPDALVNEAKTRARVRLNTARRQGVAGAATLRDALHQVAREVGFADWDHARRVLAGMVPMGGDHGNFWHAPRTGMLLHLWFSDYVQAQQALAQAPDQFLLPYRRQFFVVQAPFIVELGLNPQDPAWRELEHDLVAGYGSAAWLWLAWQRLHAPLSAFDSR